MTYDLSRLLRPKSIAVLGGYWAERVVEQCTKMGFSGEVWPVSPSRDVLAGVRCVPTVEDLPSAPDAAFIAVNRHAALDTIGKLQAMGGGGGVCFASGFSEVGEEGVALQKQFVEIAGEMPVLGPNCYGLINYLDGALLWPDQHGGKRLDPATGRGVALLSQSGNIGLNLTMNRRGVPIAYMGALGNQAQTGLAELTAALAQDARVSAIGIYLEGLTDAPAFADAVSVAHDHGVPVAVLKAGRSAKGAELALSHTGSLAGSDMVMDAFFERIGAISVPSITTLLEAMKILHVYGRLPGKTMISMSCSGGEALMVSDIAEHTDLDFRALSTEEKSRIKSTTHDLVTVDNPFDYHTFDWGKWDRAGKTYKEVLSCDFDMTALVLDFPRDDRCDPEDWINAAEALRKAQVVTNARAAIIASMPDLLPEALADKLVVDGIVPLLGLEDALHAIDACSTPVPTEPAPTFPSQSPSTTGSVKNLTEWDAKRKLAGHGLIVPDGALCQSSADVLAAFSHIGEPVVAKAVGRDLLHKTELGAVRLNLANAEAVIEAYDILAPMGEAVLVEAMAARPVAELIVGVRRDPIVGLYMLLGSGGIAAELVRDTKVLLLPVSEDAVRRALSGLQLAPLLTGFRGRAKGDLDAVIRAVMAVQACVLSMTDELEELEINPLLVHAEGQGATAVDALIRVRER